MEQRRLGNSGVSVSVIGLGTWEMAGDFWGATDDETSIGVVHRALELGVTLVDTAEGYGAGHAEEVLGRALVGRRDQVVLSSKVAPDHLEPAAIEAALEGSLARLGTDHLDVYFIHWPSLDFPIGPAMEKMEQLRAQGRIRAVGVSNFSVPRLEEAGRHGVVDVLQPPYNALWREIEAEILPYCREHAIGVMPYSGLAQGLLTGTLRPDTIFPEGDRRRNTVLFQPGVYERALAAVERLRPIAERYRRSLPQLAIAWLVSRPGVTSPLLGARTVAEMEDNAAGTGWTLEPDDLAAIDAATLPVWDEIKEEGDMFGYWKRARATHAD